MDSSMYERWFCSPADLVGLDPVRARDLVVKCFYQAQHETLTRSHATMGLSVDEESIRAEAEGAVRNAFKRTGGDFGNPDKISIRRAVESLADSALAFGTPPDIVEHHRKQIDVVLAGLAD